MPAAAAKPQRQGITTSRDWHEVFAIALAGAGFLGFLALASYAPEDFPPWDAARSGDAVKNCIGPVGAAGAGGALFLFGAAAYLLPLVAMGWA